MGKLFNKICYHIYNKLRESARKAELEYIYTQAVIDREAIIGESAKIYNCQKRDSIKIGSKTILRGELITFAHGGEISIGNWSFIGEGSRIWSAKKITIGNRVLIAHNVNVHDQNSHPIDSAKRHKDQMHIVEKGFQSVNDLNEKEIVIHDDAWIGFNATILKGVTIGKGAIIGACCTITKDVPDYAIVVGNPAKVIKYTT